jgi:hypothetical protein
MIIKLVFAAFPQRMQKSVVLKATEIGWLLFWMCPGSPPIDCCWSLCIVQIRHCLHIVNWGGGRGVYVAPNARIYFHEKSVFFPFKIYQNYCWELQSDYLFFASFRPIIFYIKFGDRITLNKKNIASSSPSNKRVLTRINAHL